MSRSPRSLRQHPRFHDRCVPHYPHPARRSPPHRHQLDGHRFPEHLHWLGFAAALRASATATHRGLAGAGSRDRYGASSCPNAIHPSGFMSIRYRKPASYVPSATFRRSPGELIMPDLSTRPGSPQLRCITLAFSRQFLAPWRPLLRYSAHCAPTFFATRSLMRTRSIHRVQK
ncbi:hypothetical protein HPB49_021606 [Dermacentor silvarum]|uniref:Uncharacterized protein n=1 Tax=Dermacentor silvarum TaxID=543639 RepID=A0ACB8CB73_DERSI|nr:hypothetical protein HPB49_021606 [Dermacentor silvarum]